MAVRKQYKDPSRNWDYLIYHIAALALAVVDVEVAKALLQRAVDENLMRHPPFLFMLRACSCQPRW